MKLTTFTNDGVEELGFMVKGGDIFRAPALAKHALFREAGLTPVASDMSTLLARDELDAARRIADWLETLEDAPLADLVEAGAKADPSKIVFEAAVPRPSLILAQGLAYHAHLGEMNVNAPKNPVCLLKVPSSVTGTGQPIILPPDNSDMVDWEGEISLVIGRPCHRVSEAEALDYVAGYTIINDVSARDWADRALDQNQTQMQAVVSWGDNIHGKQFPTFTPMGPVFVSADEIPDPHAMDLETRVNGEIMQKANTSHLIFSMGRLISHFSHWYRFMPGDVISTGSPAGVGHGRNPRVYLKEGDLVEVSVSGIGTLSNPVRRSKPDDFTD